MVTSNQLSAEIRASIPFFEELLGRGMDIIEKAKEEGGIQQSVKGTFHDGTPDMVTSLDIAVGKVYVDAVQQAFPRWTVISEDGGAAKTETTALSDVVVLFDPLDDTKSFMRNEPGYSTMAAVAMRQGDVYVPLLGMIRTPHEFCYGFAHRDERTSNVAGVVTKNPIATTEGSLIGRGKNDRFGFVGPILQELGGTPVSINGMALKTLGVLRGDFDLFVQGPEMGFWDVLPATPIIEANNGHVRDWKGNNLAYRPGTKYHETGILGVASHVALDPVLEKIARVYH